MHSPRLTLFSSASRALLRLYLRPRKEPVDLFEEKIVRFGIEKVDQREEAEIRRWK